MRGRRGGGQGNTRTNDSCLCYPWLQHLDSPQNAWAPCLHPVRAALLSFVAPEALGSAALFNRVYGIPITRSQEGTATAEDKELGAARSRWVRRAVLNPLPFASHLVILC